MQNVYLAVGTVKNTSVVRENGNEILKIYLEDGNKVELPVGLINKSSLKCVLPGTFIAVKYVYANEKDFDHNNEAGYHLELVK